MKHGKGKKHPENRPEKPVASQSMTRREVVKRLGKVAYIAPTISVLSLGSIRAVAAESGCPPPDPGGGGGCAPAVQKKSRTSSRMKPKE
jgi:hypothetical protein